MTQFATRIPPHVLAIRNNFYADELTRVVVGAGSIAEEETSSVCTFVHNARENVEIVVVEIIHVAANR